MCECFIWEHDLYDAAVSRITGHHPDCPNLKIDKYSFAENLITEAEKRANKILSAKVPKPKAKRKLILSEDLIQVALFKELERKKHELIAPNIDIFYTGEMDVCSVMQGGCVNEYEIKLTRSDFKKDFLKERKHPIFRNIREGIRSGTREFFEGEETYLIQYTSPNYYYFVVPQDLIKPEEIPEYAGLIYFRKYKDFRTVKAAKKLHKERISDENRTKIADALMQCCWTFKERLEALKTENAS